VPSSRSRALYQVQVQTTHQAEDAVQDALCRFFGAASSIFSFAESNLSQVSVFLEHLPSHLPEDSPFPKSSAPCKQQRRAGAPRQGRGVSVHLIKKRLGEVLQDIARSGFEIGPGRISIRSLPARNWAESWKRHFKTLEIGGKLLIKPSWSTRKPRPGQQMMIMDPGLSFGTGHHPTTAFCLAQIVTRAPEFGFGPNDFLDIGTGSGILAIAAVKMGFRPVIAFDQDSSAVEKAIENARRNGVESRIEFSCKDLLVWRPPSERFVMVCANLQSDLLIQEAPRIVKSLAKEGCLVLAGILQCQFRHVQKRYCQIGLDLGRVETIGEWTSGVFGWAR
jgi:ribosomal protein L11 methyltransferase